MYKKIIFIKKKEMATITLKGNEIHTKGALPAIASKLADTLLIANTLAEKKISDDKGKRIVLNIFPSIDTGICAMSVKQFNKDAANLENTVVLSISKDLPFALSRFCGAEGIENVETLSAFRTDDFSALEIVDGPLKGLLSRCIIVADEEGTVLYTEQVPEITIEPNYKAALAAL